MKKKYMLLKIMEYYGIISMIIFSWAHLEKRRNILIFYPIFMMLIFVILRDGKINIKKHITVLSIAVLLIALIPCSINMTYTIKDGMFFLIATLYIISISNVYTELGFYSILRKYFVISILASFIYILFIPSRGLMIYDGELVPQGVYYHKNILARNMVLASIIFINFSLEEKNLLKKLYNILFLILSISLIFISQSTTSIMYVSIFIIINIIIKIKKYNKTKYTKGIVFICILFNISILFISNPEMSKILENITFLGKNLTFTSRNDIWDFSLQHIVKNPLIGYGYSAFWTNSIISNTFINEYGFHVPHAHNGYLNIILEGGLLVLLLIVYIINSNINNVLNRKNKWTNNITWSILMFTILINLTEAALIDTGSLLFWMCMVFTFINDNKSRSNKIKM